MPPAVIAVPTINDSRSAFEHHAFDVGRVPITGDELRVREDLPAQCDRRLGGEYDEFSQGARAVWLALFGPGNIELIDISVRVEGEWAYVIYKMVRDGEVLVEITSTYPDVYRKVGSRWYDVAEDPMEPGYNVEDVP